MDNILKDDKVTENKSANITESKSIPEATVPEGMTMVPKTEWNEMLSIMKKVKEDQDGFKRPETVKESYVRMRVHEDGVVIGFGKTWTEPKNTKLNPEDEKRLFWIVYTSKLGEAEEKKEHKVDYCNFINETPVIKARVIEQKVRPMREVSSTGLTQNPNPKDEKDFKSVMTEFDSVSVESMVKIRFEDGEYKGKEITLNRNYLNI